MNASLVSDFESGQLDLSSFTHREHIFLAWHYLGHQSVPETMMTLCQGLRALAVKAGKGDGFHKTMTCAWVGIIAARRFAMTTDHRFEDFASKNQDLFTDGRRCLHAYYQPQTLASQAARSHFLWPDGLGEIPQN